MDNLIDRARAYAKKVHGSTLDDSGANYFEAHICNVVKILEQVTDDEEIIAAAYLHDVIEDCSVHYSTLKRKFGHAVADLVNEVTHEGEKDNGYYFPRLKSRRGITIKLADRLSNVSRMDCWGKRKRGDYLLKTKFWDDSPKPNKKVDNV